MPTKITIIWDLETTGFCPMPLLSKYHRVIQICAQCIETGQMFDEFVDPCFVGGIPPASSAIHKIFNSDISNALPINDVIRRMVSFFSFGDYDIVEMIAHNSTYFDEIILKKEDTMASLPSNVVFWDTLPWCRENFPTMTSYSLGDLYKAFYKVDFENAHRATADVTALKRIYVDHIKTKREIPLTVLDIKRQEVLRECITSIRFMGPWRATLCYKKAKIETVSQLISFAAKKIMVHKKAFDMWLRDEIGIWNVSQRLFVISRVVGIPPWKEELREYIVGEGDCIDCVDYYIKYRYVLSTTPPNHCLYNRGLMNIFHKVN